MEAGLPTLEPSLIAASLPLVGCTRCPSLQEIGLELDLTRERVRQIQVIALNKIKRNFGDQLMNFL